jgi:hypothetical protein
MRLSELRKMFRLVKYFVLSVVQIYNWVSAHDLWGLSAPLDNHRRVTSTSAINNLHLFN